MSEEIEVDGCECYERLQTSVQYGYLSTVCVCVCVCVRVMQYFSIFITQYFLHIYLRAYMDTHTHAYMYD